MRCLWVLVVDMVARRRLTLTDGCERSKESLSRRVSQMPALIMWSTVHVVKAHPGLALSSPEAPALPLLFFPRL